jgi:hypothetical protein
MQKKKYIETTNEGIRNIKDKLERGTCVFGDTRRAFLNHNIRQVDAWIKLGNRRFIEVVETTKVVPISSKHLKKVKELMMEKWNSNSNRNYNTLEKCLLEVSKKLTPIEDTFEVRKYIKVVDKS